MTALVTETDRATGPQPDGPGPRLLLGLPRDGSALTLAAHLATHGPLPLQDRDLADSADLAGMVDVVALAEASGLRGRGGAGFPLGTKLRTVRDAANGSTRRRPIVVVNAAESEPASRKDAVLVTRSPHLVLDGAALAARSVGAREVAVWLHRGRSAMADALRTALAERLAAHLPDPSFRLVEGPSRYLAGEATAVVAHLSGRPSWPITAPPLIAAKGVTGRPTLLSNAETLAHLALLVRHGVDWFRSSGTAAEPGTMLLTVLGAVAHPGVVETSVGTRLDAILAAAGGVVAGPAPAALLVGGYAGTWLPYERADLPYSKAGLVPAGADPGVGMVVVLPAGACPVAETARLAAWLSDERVGQCGPCLNGLPALAGAARALAYGGPDAARAPEQLRRWAGMVAGRGACHHPDGVVRLVRSLLGGFPEEIDRHAAGPACREALPAIVLPGRGDGSWR